MSTTYYLCVLQCPPMKEWKGRGNGSISMGQRILNDPVGSQGTIKKVLEEAYASFVIRGKEICGERKTGGGRQ